MKFRSCACRRLERDDVDWWDDPSPEGSFYWSRESFRGVTYRTFWIRMPYDAGEWQHSWHCLPVVHFLREHVYDDRGQITSTTENPVPGEVMPPEERRAYWKWDGNEDRPTLWPSIGCGAPENNWHAYLTAGRLEACE